MTEEHGHFEDPREEIAAALVGDDPVWITLVDPPSALSVDRGRPTRERTGIQLDVIAASSPDAWREHVRGSQAVVVDMLGLRRSLGALPAALDAARQAAPNGVFALMVTMGHLSAYSARDLRSALIDQFSVDWIVWCEWPGSAAASWAVVVVRPGGAAPPVVRLVDGRGCEIEETVNLIGSCQDRQGGYAGREGVRRRPLPRNLPWSWWELSPEADAEHEDTLELGESRAFSELAQIRVARPRATAVLELDDPDALADGHVGLVQGSLIGRGDLLAPPTRQVARAEVDARTLLSDGDCVVSAISRDTLRMAVVPPDYPLAAAHSTILLVRFDQALSPTDRAMLIAYMRSARFARSVSSELLSIGNHIRVSAHALNQARVPRFSDHLVEAWQRSGVARQQFTSWARELEERERAFFDAPNFGAELPLFLTRSRVAADRVNAAIDVDTLEGRIRQRYPHPLAFRFENIGQMDHGAERIRETLACAEHLVLYLAFLGLANLGGGPTRSLQAWTEDRGSLSLDWGKADSLLLDATAQASRTTDPLSLPIPEYVELHAGFADQRSAVSQGCREMRAWRNDDSHLARCTPSELVPASERFAEHLEYQHIIDSGSHWASRPIIENRLAPGVDLFAHPGGRAKAAP